MKVLNLFFLHRNRSEAEAEIRAAKAEAETARLAATRARVFEVETQTEDEREPSPPPRPPPPTILVVDEEEAFVRPVAPLFVDYLQVRIKLPQMPPLQRLQIVDISVQLVCDHIFIIFINSTNVSHFPLSFKVVK